MSHRFNEYSLPLESSLKHAVSYLESLSDRPVDKGTLSDILKIFQRVCFSDFGSTSPSVTVDKLSSAAIIS